MDKPDISIVATGRSESMFRPDLRAYDQELRERVTGKKLLVVGGAGSIGSNTIKTLADFDPHTLHVVDHDENGLAELVRQLRSRPTPINIPDFRTLPIDYGSVAMQYLLKQSGPYDFILNFAAIKHVRSEKDALSILQMLDTNIVKQARLREWIDQYAPSAHYFSVSTDKAANPVSFMGATKRFMEHVIFQTSEANPNGHVTSARFANVAFSNGSLLQSFQNRLARREPLACPTSINRYFVSLEESGHLCTLASILAPKDHIVIPNLDPNKHLVPLEDIARKFLAHHGYEAEIFEDEKAACIAAPKAGMSGAYPLILTPANTSGEKPYEEFVGENETSVEIGYSAIKAVPYRQPDAESNLPKVLGALKSIVEVPSGAGVDKAAVKDLIGEIEPRFLTAHIDSKHNLDQRA